MCGPVIRVNYRVVALLLVLRGRWGRVDGRTTLDSLARVSAATLLMGLAVTGVLILGRRAGLGAFVLLCSGGIIGAVVYAAARLPLGAWSLRLLTGRAKRDPECAVPDAR